MTLWQITGATSNESGGGPSALFTVTSDDATPPDPAVALELAAPGFNWARLDRVDRVASIPDAWDAGAGNEALNALARQMTEASAGAS